MLRRSVLLFCSLATAIALQEGDSCLVNGQSGICQLQTACSEYPKMKALGIRPKICGYYGEDRKKIICCPTIGRGVLNSKARKSEQYCEQYRRNASTEVRIGALSVDADAARQIFLPDCDEAIGLIVGGNTTKNGEFPHMAALGYFNAESSQYDFRCGGSLISDRYVLTAAHCVYGSNHHSVPDIVRLGDNILHSTDDGLSGSDFGVKCTIRHPDYKPSKNRYNDIALIELNQTVEFNLTIRPACLWSSADVNIPKAIATGYGATESHGESAGMLLKVGLDLLDSFYCGFSYLGQRNLPDSIIDSQLCTQSPEGDTCQGDSGGPLQIPLEGHKCLYHIIGVTSFGTFCGRNSPGVYTKVSSYLDWIESIVWP